MPRVTSNEIVVALCDWRGRLVWSSEYPNPGQVEIGEHVWCHLPVESRDNVRMAISRVIALHNPQVIEAQTDPETHFRVWFWPLDSPNIAVCILAARIPKEMSRLTDREQECLCYLAHGLSTQQVAAKLHISVSTLHTHFRRCREKLGLPDIKALTVFAARHCCLDTPDMPHPPSEKSKRRRR